MCRILNLTKQENSSGFSPDPGQSRDYVGTETAGERLSKAGFPFSNFWDFTVTDLIHLCRGQRWKPSDLSLGPASESWLPYCTIWLYIADAVGCLYLNFALTSPGCYHPHAILLITSCVLGLEVSLAEVVLGSSTGKPAIQTSPIKGGSWQTNTLAKLLLRGKFVVPMTPNILAAHTGLFPLTCLIFLYSAFWNHLSKNLFSVFAFGRLQPKKLWIVVLLLIG